MVKKERKAAAIREERITNRFAECFGSRPLDWSLMEEVTSVNAVLFLTLLFSAGSALFQTHENLEHLAMMQQVLGPIPESVCAAAMKNKSKYFTKRWVSAMSTFCTPELESVIHSVHCWTHISDTGKIESCCLLLL